MSEFDEMAMSWDDDPSRVERAAIIADFLKSKIDLNHIKSALEYGSGTGLLSFELKDEIDRITLMDASANMTEVARIKIETTGAVNLKAIKGDLLIDEYPTLKVELIYTLLTLHHVIDVKKLLVKFNDHLTPEGYLVIIDLETEDGSFHDGEFHGHKGFSRSTLEGLINDAGLAFVSYDICYTINKISEEGVDKNYPVFMLVAKKTYSHE